MIFTIDKLGGGRKKDGGTAAVAPGATAADCEVVAGG